MRRGRFLLEETDQGVEVRGEKILASEMGDDALLDLVPFPIRLHQSDRRYSWWPLGALTERRNKRGLLMHCT